MTNAVSAVDIIKLPEFTGLSTIDLINPKNDSKIAPYAFQVGCYVDVPPQVQACKHRTFGGKVVLDYRYVYPERKDRAWVESSGCSLRSRIDSQEDTELRSDMIKMSQQGFNWPKFKQEELLKYEVCEDLEDSHQMMKTLQDIQIQIRGHLEVDEDMFNPVNNTL